MNKEELHNYCKDASNEIIKQDEEIRKLIKENEKLKEALAAGYYCKYANKCDDLMDCSREEYNSMCEENMKLYNENDDLKQENQELKKQTEKCYCNRTDCSARIKDSKKYDSLVQKVETQHQEFIEYLENCIIELKKESTNILQNTINLGIIDITNAILQKYKSIIGDDK